jgi:hypothetical protein
MRTITFTIPIQTVSAANKREHPMTRHRRVKAERLATFVAFPRRARISVPAVVSMVRSSARELDDDNLRSALKPIRDEIARMLQVDDRDPRVDFRYDQEKGDLGVLVEIESGPDVHVRATCPDHAGCPIHRKLKITPPRRDRRLWSGVSSASYPARTR